MKNKINNLGFTLVELLGAIVVLGVLSGFAVPAISKVVRNSKNKIYTSDALKLVSNAAYTLRKDNNIPRPNSKQCVMMSLFNLDNGNFDESPYGGSYVPSDSYVIISKENGDYKYYVRLVEKIKANQYRGIRFNTKEELESNDIQFIQNIPGLNEYSDSTILSKVNHGANVCRSLYKYTNVNTLPDEVAGD